MTNKAKIGLATSGLLIAFAFGRYSAPESIKIVEVEKKVTSDKKESEKERTRKIVKKKVTKPDGTVTEIIKEVDTSKNSKKSDKNVIEDKSKSSEVVKNSGLLTIEGLAGYDITNSRLTYGAHVSRNLIGPIRLGVFGLTSSTVGVSLGLGF